MRMLLPLILLVGCGTELTGNPAEPGTPYVAPAAPEPSDGLAIASTVSLAEDIGDATGVWITPDTGRVGVVGAWSGLFELKEGAWTSLASASDLLDSTGATGPFTDAAALSGDRFAVTVPSDGLLFDASTHETQQHFCYEPGDSGLWIEQSQVTHSLTYDPVTDQLFANPQTFEGSFVLSSELGVFHAESGTPVQWYGLPDSGIVASGLAVSGTGVFLLSIGDSLYSYDVKNQDLVPLVDLGTLGVQSIAGLAIHPKTDSLWVVDDGARSLIELTGWR